MKFLGRILEVFRGPVSTEPEPRGLFALMNFAWVGQAVYVATKLGVFDELVAGAKSADDVAESLGARPSHMLQVMRSLASFEILATDDEGRFQLTPLSASLTADQDSWMRQYILLWGEQLYPAAGQMLGMVQSGTVAFELAFGQSLYDHYKAVPEAGSRFVDFMNSVTDWQRSVVVEAFDFGPYEHLVDVGGGRGSMLTAILLANPHLRGTLQDQAHMGELVQERIVRLGLADRCKFAPGSFLESVVTGGDLYFIKHVLHDWPDDDVRTILGNIATAMSDGATLIVVEGVMDPGDGVDRVMKMRDLEQMIWTSGRVRTREEFAGLLRDAGLRIEEVRRTSLLDTSLIVARKNRD